MLNNYDNDDLMVGTTLFKKKVNLADIPLKKYFKMLQAFLDYFHITKAIYHQVIGV